MKCGICKKAIVVGTLCLSCAAPVFATHQQYDDLPSNETTRQKVELRVNAAVSSSAVFSPTAINLGSYRITWRPPED